MSIASSVKKSSQQRTHWQDNKLSKEETVTMKLLHESLSTLQKIEMCKENSLSLYRKIKDLDRSMTNFATKNFDLLTKIQETQFLADSLAIFKFQQKLENGDFPMEIE